MNCRRMVLLAVLAMAACGGPPPPLRVFVEPAHRPVAEAFLAFTPIDGAQLETREKPKEALGGEGLQVALALGLECEGCGEGSA